MVRLQLVRECQSVPGLAGLREAEDGLGILLLRVGPLREEQLRLPPWPVDLLELGPPLEGRG